MPLPRWLILADSLPLPRPEVPYERTWPYLMQKKFPSIDWINRSMRTAMTDRLNTEGGGAGEDCLEWFAPDTVILELGIVDCAPRAFSKGLLSDYLLPKLPSDIRNAIYQWKIKLTGRSSKNAWVTKKQFESNIQKYLERCKKRKASVIALGILPAGAEMRNKNPRIQDSIDDYNHVLETAMKEYKLGHWVPPFEKDKSENMTTDGYHINQDGHEWVVSQLSPLVEKLVTI